MIGQTLAHYRITAAIGAGGMGEVYRASDTKLEREVAIKLLPTELAADPERLARFEREAKLLASLNHPNIAHVYGFESATTPDGSTTHFLAMELVPGEDLAERLKRGPIPVDDALAIARQIAQALEEAHAKGIVHRDLKPGNVKVTPDGKVKVLDFGLAKAYAGESASGSGPDLSQSPTLAHTGTQAGVILGTAAYMSPEQARGKTVDKRTDIWAFGVLLYEMLTGRRLFEGETVTDVLAAVVRQEIDWSALPAGTPGGVRRVLGRCLQRDPSKRLRDVADASFDLEDAAPLADEAASGRGSDEASRRSLVRRLGTAAVLVLLGILAGALVRGRPPRAPAPRPVHFAIAVSLGEDLLRRGSGVVLSPDGTRIAFFGSQDGRQGLFLRSLDQLDARLIPGTENATAPFFSPDGEWLAFFSVAPGSRGMELMKTRIDGGAPIRVAEAASTVFWFNASGSWSEGGEILFCGSSPVIQRVAALGGPATAATELDASRGEQRHLQPVWLPGGRGLLYVANVAGGRPDVMVASGDGGKGRVLVEGASSPRYAVTGHLLFVREKTLLAVTFDLRSQQVTGAPFPVLDGLDVAINGAYRTARFDLSPNGTLAYLADRPAARRGQLVLVDHRGKATAAFEETGTYLVPRLSPDGTRVAYAAIDDPSGQRDVWIGDLKRGTRTRLTLANGASFDPIWTPDGQGVTYASARDQGAYALFTSPVDGDREPTRLSRPVDPGSGGRLLFPRAWLRDGRRLVFHAVQASDDIGILQADSGKEEMLLAGPFAELEPSLSPDERFMAYVSDESGRREVYVRSLDGAARRVQVSSEGGDEPVWSPRGNEIFYRQGPRMIAVPVSTAVGGVTLGTPAVLFEGPYDVDAFNHDATNYDVTPDGQRLLMVRPVADAAGSREQLNVVVNWYEELTRRQGGAR